MQLPAIFTEKTKEVLGSEYPLFEEALHTNSPVSIRLNKDKDPRIYGLERALWCDTGYYLPERPLFTADPLLHAGCYYVQEASSMFLEQVVRQLVSNSVKALDLCAAPGGKSTHLSSLLPSGSLLLSNEIVRNRAYILYENACKWGNPSHLISQDKPATIGKLRQFFDLILADVPCSGEGMFRKDPNAIEEWSPENVALCAERQRQIVGDIWPSLKPGGLLIYSTCTYNTSENEENVAWIAETLGADSVSLNIPAEWNIAGSAKGNRPVYRFYPHRVRGEGFFMAILRKNGSEQTNDSGAYNKRANNKQGRRDTSVPAAVRNWLQPESDFHFFNEGNEIYAIPEAHRQTAELSASRLNLMTPAIRVATLKGKDIIPAHQTAMSTACNHAAFPVWETDKDTALRYLRKEAINDIPGSLPKGHVLVSYEGHLLGFVKNLGSRANNLYPSEWRIRMKLV